MKSFLPALTIFLLLYNCAEETVNEDLFDMPYKGGEDIVISALSLEPVLLEEWDEASTGDFYVTDKRIGFINLVHCTVKEWTLEGELIGQFVGPGRGPNETMIGRVEGYTIDTPYRILVGPSADYHLFDENWQSVKYDHFQSHPRDHISVNSMPPTDDLGLYSLNYAKMTVKEYEDKLFISISTDHPYFHPFLSVYYEKCSLIVQIDRAIGVWEKMVGRFSPVYQKYNTIGQFSFFSFEMDEEGRFYVCFEIDPKIYVYDQEFNPLYSFGSRGSDMDTDYTELKLQGSIHDPDNLDMIQEVYVSDRANKGSYKFIKLVEPLDLLFRTYSKGGESEVDGLQIYQGETLIGDVEVPKDFRVVGYRAPYFYGQGPGEGREMLYRFQLPEIALKKQG